MNKQAQSIIPVAIAILREEKRPLHYKEITRRLLARHQLRGNTPHESVRSRLGTDTRFKRVAEGVYALAEWEEYPAARFAKDIAYDILKSRRRPMTSIALGEAILRERQFVGSPGVVAHNVIRTDNRFRYDNKTDLVSLIEWKARK